MSTLNSPPTIALRKSSTIIKESENKSQLSQAANQSTLDGGDPCNVLNGKNVL